MPNLSDLRLPIQDAVPSAERTAVCCDAAATYLHELLAACPCTLPAHAKEVTLLCTHLRPHLDEYMAMLLFRSCLPEGRRNIPVEETVINNATHDARVCERWAHAAVFGMGGVQNGGAHPLLLFDEHVQPGKRHNAYSSVALVVDRLFGTSRLPRPLFHCIREIDLIDAYGGAHPKHLSNYILRVHDCADNKSVSHATLSKQAAVEACLVAFIRAFALEIPYWHESFWRERAISSLKVHAKTSPLRQQNGFDHAIAQLHHNIKTFRQPRFPVLGKEAEGQRLYQSLVIPFAAALCPLVWGDLGQAIIGLFWDARLLTQMSYTLVLQTLEEQLGSEPDDGEEETPIGRIIFRNVRTKVGNAAMTPWILEIQPKPGISNVRQALLSFVRKYHSENALTILRNTANKTLVVSRSAGIPQEQWQALVQWLVEREGSSDTEGNPGCWHIVSNAQGVPADFLLNGNPAHRYVPPTSLTVDQLAEWLREHPCR